MERRWVFCHPQGRGTSLRYVGAFSMDRAAGSAQIPPAFYRPGKPDLRVVYAAADFGCAFRKSSRSALIRSACVVGIP